MNSCPSTCNNMHGVLVPHLPFVSFVFSKHFQPCTCRGNVIFFAVLKSEASRVWSIPGVMLDETCTRRGPELDWLEYSTATPMQRANSTTGKGVFCTHCCQLGHARRDCDKSAETNAEGYQDACFKCESVLHSIRNCRNTTFSTAL